MQTLERGIDGILGGKECAKYLAVMGHFHHYSFGNVALIAMQRPDATRVAGYRKWQELGRQVKRGEQGMKILVPHKMRFDRDGEESEESVIVRIFGVGTVFDVAHTEGDDLPEPPVVAEIRESTEPGSVLFSHLTRYLDAQGVPVIREATRPAKGYWEPRRRLIALDLDLSGDQAAKTLAHETAHFVANHQLGMPSDDVETIAESAAFVVLNLCGLDSTGYSFPYVARWAKDSQVLKRNLDAIQKTAHQMI
ncbi:MAG TPA: ArdC-like ssDNA-binding domain-containing protein [Chloroflexota bacterium]|nr:ArdC-like ssDNA-binding domain-containing protein [Chloroflexota bacterium]